LITSDPHTASQQKELAGTIFEAAQRGAALSRQLLTFSRKGMAKCEKRPLRMNDLVEDIRKMLQRVLPKNVAMGTRLADDLGETNASADQLTQVLMNLAMNASHAMPDGGTLTIETRNARVDPGYCRLHPEIQPGDFVLMAVSDTGHGMDKQTMQRIYEPFFTTKKVGEGTGLGLSVVYGIVKNHGGNILCYSEVGVGTTFKVYLPALQATGEAATTQPKAKLALRGGNETILIVDDEAHIRNLVRGALTKIGYTIISAGDGESALLRHSEEGDRIRLVLLDLGMPGMGGWECLKRLHTINPGLPVLITTGYGFEDLLKRARQEGAAGLISKPYQMEELDRSVREILDGSPPQKAA
jgi:CheY-like chemotaxis protein